MGLIGLFALFIHLKKLMKDSSYNIFARYNT